MLGERCSPVWNRGGPELFGSSELRAGCLDGNAGGGRPSPDAASRALNETKVVEGI